MKDASYVVSLFLFVHDFNYKYDDEYVDACLFLGSDLMGRQLAVIVWNPNYFLPTLLFVVWVDKLMFTELEWVVYIP